MSTELSVTNPQSAAESIIREAMKTGVSPEALRELLNVRREWEADEARKAFNISISEFQRRAPIVEKGDKAYDKYYARLDRIWRTIRPLLTELGLSVTFQICELRPDNVCHVEGQLRHRDGHSEKIIQDVPVADALKGQNSSQQFGSASTYARHYALCSALGVVTGDDLDDDGNKAGFTYISTEQANEIGDLLDACRGLQNWNERAFFSWAGADVVADIKADRYNDVRTMLSKKLGNK